MKKSEINRDKMIQIKINEGNRNWYYETSEQVLRCPNCKNDYKTAKQCRRCKCINLPHIKVRTGLITKDLTKYSCSCVFSSFWRFGTHWKQNHPKSRCKHVKIALNKIKRYNETQT